MNLEKRELKIIMPLRLGRDQGISLRNVMDLTKMTASEIVHLGIESLVDESVRQDPDFFEDKGVKASMVWGVQKEATRDSLSFGEIHKPLNSELHPHQAADEDDPVVIALRPNRKFNVELSGEQLGLLGALAVYKRNSVMDVLEQAVEHAARKLDGPLSDY